MDVFRVTIHLLFFSYAKIIVFDMVLHILYIEVQSINIQYNNTYRMVGWIIVGNSSEKSFPFALRQASLTRFSQMSE